MLASVLIVLFSALIGAYIRYVARENRRPWLVTAGLAAAFLVLTFLKPPGQELFAILWGIAGGLAAGVLVFGLIARVRR